MKIITSSLIIILSLASLGLIGQVNSICYDLTKQYLECNFLNMTLVDDGWRQYYAPDTSLENNQLDDSIYSWLLGNLTLDDGLEAMRTINQAISNCDSEICQCIKLRKSYSNDEIYEPFFNNDENFAGVKNIISWLDLALYDDRISAEELQSKSGFGADDDQNLLSLTAFCSNAEYTYIRNAVYQDYDKCFNYDYQIYLTCNYYARVDVENRVALTEYDEERRERNLVCDVLLSRDCVYEQRLFNVMSMWVEASERKDVSEQGLLFYLDSLIEAADEIPLDDLFDSAYISFSQDTIYYKAFNTGADLANLSSIDSSFFALSSDKLSVLVEIDASDSEDMIQRLTITVNDGTGPVELVIDNNLSIEQLNQTLTNSNGENVIQTVFYNYFEYGYSYFDIYDFNSKSILTISTGNYLSLTSPSSLFRESSGLLVDGLPQNGEQENIDNKPCREICEAHIKSISRLGQAVDSAARENINRCMEIC